MPDAQVLISFFIMHWLITMSPGPNTVLVTRTALASGRAHAFAAIAGICASAVVWVSAAVLGLQLVFAAAPWLRTFVTLLGAGYLIWLGIGMIRTGGRPAQGPEPGTPRRPLLRRSFGEGFLANMTNPKTLAYFSSVFVTALPAGTGMGAILALVLIAWTCTVGWYGGLALMLGAPAIRRVHRRGTGMIDRLSGLVMVMFGLRTGMLRS